MGPGISFVSGVNALAQLCDISTSYPVNPEGVAGTVVTTLST
jgi:hypothetical protein